jgi:serine/threonine protein kinase
MTQEVAANTTLLHYRIVSKIGEGGMGEVYLAQDTKLDRKAAIKFLNEQFSKDDDKLNRFVREARAASALNHPKRSPAKDPLFVLLAWTWPDLKFVN